MSSEDNTKRWFVYILQCADETLYTGITTDLERRLKEHNSLKTGAKFTRARRPVKLVYHEDLPDRSQASKREAVIKNLKRKEKQQLINTSTQKD